MDNTKSCGVNRPDLYRDQALFMHAYKGLRWFYIIFWPGGMLTFYDPFFLIMVSQPENLFFPGVIFLKPRRHPPKAPDKFAFLQGEGAVCYKEKIYLA